LDSFPIEVGVAIATDCFAPIVSWSALIAPVPDWDLASLWDPDAERIHGISQLSLRQGKVPAEVMRTLNQLVAAGTPVWCDGGHYDVHWLGTLGQAAGVRHIFELRDIGTALSNDAEARNRYLEALNRSKAPHRAGPDAERICAALVHAVGS
jgi:hypothetical protein